MVIIVLAVVPEWAVKSRANATKSGGKTVVGVCLLAGLYTNMLGAAWHLRKSELMSSS